MVKGLFQCNPVKAIHDDYYTRKISWQNIIDFIPKDKVIWEPFYSENSDSASHLKELGFDVIWKDADFFESNEGQIVVSNCPFSLKKEVLTRLKELNKAFILILPSTCLQTKYFKELFEDEKIQIIFPRLKINYDKYVDVKLVEKKDNCSFYSCYIYLLGN